MNQNLAWVEQDILLPCGGLEWIGNIVVMLRREEYMPSTNRRLTNTSTAITELKYLDIPSHDCCKHSYNGVFGAIG
jgi:hypothetical protein